jgi:hypothetical protein
MAEMTDDAKTIAGNFYNYLNFTYPNLTKPKNRWCKHE